MSLSDVYNKIVGSLTPSNNSLLDQGTSTYTSITTSSSSNSLMTASQNQQIVSQLNAQQQQLANQNPYLQGTGYFNYQSASINLASGVTYSNIDLGMDVGFSINPEEEKKKKDKEMLVNILKSKLQDAR